ncbi:MAG: aldo/keto reductase [Thaumarchaeota archaeon]|nr:aldo/keto reductase [Candidatus Calditenuaceae archaeon]MDW8187627.1 aldo/keto reductase [Nitrososphaerota archaeon]
MGKTSERVAEIGLGTWMMGGGSKPDHSKDKECIEAIKYAIELGMTHIDTAEMYGSGHAEELVGEAIKEFPRDELFIASKVWPTNLRYDQVLRSCDSSLRRLGLKSIDLYMIHWPSNEVPLRESMRALEKLYKDGKIRYIGVSNFSVELLEEARSCLSVTDVVANQVEYNLLSRSIEVDLLPHCRREGITITAYSPLAQGKISSEVERGTKLGRELVRVARKHGVTPVQVALNWVLYRENVITIPKAVSKKHLEEDAGASGWRLDEQDYRALCDASAS